MTATKPVKIATIAQLKRAMLREPGRFFASGWTVKQDYTAFRDRPAGAPAYLIVTDAYRQETIHVQATPEDHPEFPV